MRKVPIIIAIAIVLITGCVNQKFVKAVDNHVGVILPEYKTYLDNDTTLDTDTKRIRKQSADKLQELINTAKE